MMKSVTILISIMTFAIGITLGALISQSSQSLESGAKASNNRPVIKWRLAQSWPINLPIFSASVKKMTRIVHTLSEGRFTIIIDGKNKHKAPLEIFDLVKHGQYQMGHSASYYWKGKVPNTLFFTTLPFGMTTMEQYAWFYHGGGNELMAEVYTPHDLLSFPGGNTGNQMAGWFQKAIDDIKDLEGLKIRIPGFAGEVMAKIGANPVNIPAGELYTSLDRKTIDAVEWMGPSLDVPMGFHKIANYYYTGWHEPGSELQFLINKTAYDKLPQQYQHILQTAMKIAAFEMYIEATHENNEKLAEIQNNYKNVQIKTFPQAVINALNDATTALLEEKAANDPLAERILSSRQHYKRKARAWTLVSDYTYLSTMKQLQ